jgi:hypothetical protein
MVDDKDLEEGGRGLIQRVSWCCLEGMGTNEKIIAIGVVSEIRTEEHPNPSVVFSVQQLHKSFVPCEHLKFTRRPHSVSAYTDCWLH